MSTRFIVGKDSFQHSLDPSSGAVDMTPWMDFIEAINGGLTIQGVTPAGEWRDMQRISFSEEPSKYRIKPIQRTGSGVKHVWMNIATGYFTLGSRMPLDTDYVKVEMEYTWKEVI